MMNTFRKVILLFIVLLLCYPAFGGSAVSVPEQTQSGELPETLNIANEVLDVTFKTSDATLFVVDLRTGRKWEQKSSVNAVVLDAKTSADGLSLRLLEPSVKLNIGINIKLEPEQPELTVELAGEGDLAKTISFPHPFVTGEGTFLVMAVNEGISYPVDDKSLSPMWYYLYGGHGLCMPWYGVTDGQEGIMTIVETPDDAAVRVPRLNSFLCLAPEWQPQKGKFVPARKMRYIFFERGGYAAMCKRYRSYAKRTGLLKTLEQKRKENPNVDLVIGAVNVWCWEKDSLSIVREMKSLGIKRILWSNRCSPDVITP